VPHLPAEVAGRRGRPRVWPLRRIVEAILYLDRTGCPWRYVPQDFSPWRTAHGYFAAWRDDGMLARLQDMLRPGPGRGRAGSGADRAGDRLRVGPRRRYRARASRGWDYAKKVNGRKRHIAVDALGLLLAEVITAASVPDRDAARPPLWNLHRACRASA